MKLHRAHAKPQWEEIPRDRQNQWQRLAASTGGWLTAANLATFVGFGLVLFGLVLLLQEQYWASLILVAIGRLFDIVDGWLAETTGTKSPLGEMLDATIDKVGGVLTIGALFVAHAVPIWVLLTVFIPQAIISLVALKAYFSQVRLHPSRAGKNSMALGWVSLFGHWIVKALNEEYVGLQVGLVITTIGSAVCAGWALYGYLQDFRSAHPSDATTTRDS